MRTFLLLLCILHSANGLTMGNAPARSPSLRRLRGGSTKTPGETYQMMAAKGAVNAQLPTEKILHQAFMAGWYVAIGGIFSLIVAGAAGLNPEMTRLVIGAIFPIGLIFVLQAAGQLMTGNFALMTMAFLEGKITASQALRSFGLAGFGNAMGCLSMAVILRSAGILQGGAANVVAATALKKCSLPFHQVLLRSIFCNWLVCLAIFLASQCADMPGKIMSIWSCIPMFVTIGLEHSVANMFFLPLGKMAGADLSYATILTKNILIVTLGNFIGGGIVLASGMSYQFGKLGQ